MIREIFADVRLLELREEAAAIGAILAFAGMIFVWGLAIQ